MSRPSASEADRIFGQAVQRLRWDKDWSQLELSCAAGLSTHATISRIESGHGCLLATAIAVADALGTDITTMYREMALHA